MPAARPMTFLDLQLSNCTILYDTKSLHAVVPCMHCNPGRNPRSAPASLSNVEVACVGCFLWVFSLGRSESMKRLES